MSDHARCSATRCCGREREHGDARDQTFWRAPGPRRDPPTNADHRRATRAFTNWDKRRR